MPNAALATLGVATILISGWTAASAQSAADEECRRIYARYDRMDDKAITKYRAAERRYGTIDEKRWPQAEACSVTRELFAARERLWRFGVEEHQACTFGTDRTDAETVKLYTTLRRVVANCRANRPYWNGIY